MALANAYFSAVRIDDAISTWESLVASNPNLATVHNNLGVAYLDKDDAKRAIQHLEQTIGISPENVRAHANLAIAYRKDGMEESAQAAERKVAAIRARIAAKIAPTN
jgi:Tfp pilus assembly protein PilF